MKKAFSAFLKIALFILPFASGHWYLLHQSELFAECTTGGKECWVAYFMMALLLIPPLIGVYLIFYAEFLLSGKWRKIVLALGMFPIFVGIAAAIFVVAQTAMLRQ